MQTSILATCDSLALQIQQLREQVQRLINENAELRSRREALEAQVMEMAGEEQWWENVIFLLDEDGNDVA